jgi:hypothetical protein
MFQRMIDDLKESAGRAMRRTSFAAAAALALFVTLSFLCAAAFIAVLQNYGPIAACLAGAAIFFVIALIAAGCYMARRNKVKARAAETQKSAIHSALGDPMLVAAGLQIVRAIGIKRLIPILAVGGLALGILAGRSNAGSSESNEEPEA